MCKSCASESTTGSARDCEAGPVQTDNDFGRNHTMTNAGPHRATLEDLNRNYVRSVDEADVAWFDANLADDFLNTNPDGTLINRKAFLAQIRRGSTVKKIREHDVVIRILGNFAIIH